MGASRPYKQAGEPLYSSTDVTTSGSAINQPYNANVLQALSDYKLFSPDNDEEKKEFEKEIRDIFLNEIKMIADKDHKTYKRNRVYGVLIFIIALILTFSGIGFSIFQFMLAIEVGNFSQFDSIIEIQGAGNIIITTSTIGAFILTISLVFFFLFLNYIYKPNTKDTKIFNYLKSARDLIDENK